MVEMVLTCPKCGELFPLDQVLRKDLEASVRSQLEADAKARELILAQREESLGQKESELQQKLNGVEQRITEGVKEKEAIIREHVEKSVAEEKRVQMAALESALAEKSRLLKESQELELTWRKREGELEERAASIDLEVARKLSEQRQPIEAKIRERLLEEHRQEQSEKDRKITDMEVQLDEMRNKLKQGSQQLQGDILEVKLEDVLSTSFPFDRIEGVPTGTRGADIIQFVNDHLGNKCGSIVWEVKNTKNWSDGWVQKLKQDLSENKGDIGVVASFALPKDVQTIAFRDGVWVIDPSVAVAMATVLRSTLIQVAMARIASQGTLKKSEAVYNYLTSPSFKHRIEAIVDAFTSMKEDLDAEKRAIQRQWAKREKQIELTIAGTVGLYGDLQGIIGGTLPSIPKLELSDESSVPDNDLSSNATQQRTGSERQNGEDLPF